MADRARSKFADESGSSSRTLSHGRGGAGNMSIDRRASSGASDLKTPTIKAEKYTTGRGGTGNIASNDLAHPEIARASQDVDGVPPREYEASYHVGRGGAANVAKVSDVEAKVAKESNAWTLIGAEESGTVKSGGLVGKGKEMLEKVGLKK